MIVVDASALLELLLLTPAAPAIENRIFSPGESLHAPHLAEVLSAPLVTRDAALAGIPGHSAKIEVL